MPVPLLQQPVVYVVGVAVLLLLLLWRLGRVCRRYNNVDWGNSWVNLADGFNRWYCRRYHHLEGVRLNLPEKGPAVVASNHISGLDPLLLIAASPRPLRFLIAREQYRRFGLQWLFRAAGCIPVDRERRPDRALRIALSTLKAGEVVALFPHGRIHLDSDPPRKLKAGAAQLAVAVGCPLIPVRISGVRGQGLVLASVFIPSRVQLQTFPAIDPHGQEVKGLLQQLGGILDGSVDPDPGS